ncbi:MAG: ABC transporter ATP-binding protein [Parvicellaceae bacterium]
MKKVIDVNKISKVYDLGQVGSGTLSKDLNRFWAKLRGKPDPYSKIIEENDRTQKSLSNVIYALQNISFDVKKGEVLGIIGKNGAGKSTLLKILSEITSPSTGEIKIKGRVASLLEVGTGMHPEMTARQNIYLNGSLMGMRRTEITSKLDDIVSFAGIEKYIDTPTKRFSSGMTVRLGFAIAAFLEPEILIVDEVLAVGDAEFQKKAIGKMQDVSNQEGRTVLFVSHNMSAIKNLCNRLILLNNGKVVFDGNVDEGINYYIGENKVSKLKYDLLNVKKEKSIQEIEFKSLELNKLFFSPNDDIKFTIELHNRSGKEFKNLKIALLICDELENVIYHMNNKFIHKEANYAEKSKYQFTLNSNRLKGGVYRILLRMFHNELQQDYITQGDMTLEITKDNIYKYHNSTHISGFVQPEYSFKIIN